MDTRQPTYLSYHLSLSLPTYLPDFASALLLSSLPLSLSLSPPFPYPPLRSAPLLVIPFFRPSATVS